MRKSIEIAVAGFLLGSGLIVFFVSGCDKSDEGLTARLLEANSKNVACEKQLAETKAGARQPQEATGGGDRESDKD